MPSTLRSNKPVTIAGNKLPGVRRLISALEAAAPSPLSCKEAAFQSGLGYGYVRRLLPPLAREGKVRQVARGWYTIPAAKSVVELRFENIRLNAIVDAQVHATGAETVTQQRLDRLTRRSRGFGLNPPDVTRTFFRSWPVTVQRFQNGRRTVQCGSGGGATLSVLDILEFFAWLEGGGGGSVPPLPDEGPRGWHVSSWELNRDFENLRLDGASGMSMRAFKNVIVKLYNKPSGLRVEVRHTMTVDLRTAAEFVTRLANEYASLGIIDSGLVREIAPQAKTKGVESDA